MWTSSSGMAFSSGFMLTRAGVAAALAASSLALRAADPELSGEALSHAEFL